MARTVDEERARAEHEEGGSLNAPGLATEIWLREEAHRLAAPAEDFTATVNAIWDLYAADMLWSRRCLLRGDTFRAELGARQAWARCERAFATLGEPANGNGAGHRPELKLLAGEHAAFVDPSDEPTVVETEVA